MMPDTVPPASTKPSGILARAQRLGAGAMLAVATCASLSANMTLDYAGVASYSNSGWFTGTLDESKASGVILPGGFKLSGSETRDDSMFWYYNSYYEKTLPLYDTTGIAFIWGGKITGGTASGDSLSAPYDFTVAFTNLLAASFYGVAPRLTIGYRTEEFTPRPGHDFVGQNLPTYGSGGSNNTGDYFTTAGDYHQTGNLSLGLPETTSDLYWYAALYVEWIGETPNRFYWNGEDYTMLNGDELTVTIPDHSIDVTFVPGTPPPPPGVPDSGSSVALLGLTMMGLVCLHRRR